MGRDKAWLTVDGNPLLARSVAAARELGAEEIFISGRPGKDYSAFPYPLFLDLEPGFGLLGGIERGLNAASTPLVLVLAVVVPWMTGAFLRTLLARCDRLTGVVAKAEGRIDPLVAIYPKRCHSIALSFIVHSRHAAREFAEACVRERAVRTTSVARSAAGCLANWNSPGDVDAKRMLDRTNSPLP